MVSKIAGARIVSNLAVFCFCHNRIFHAVTHVACKDPAAKPRDRAGPGETTKDSSEKTESQDRRRKKTVTEKPEG